MQSYQVLTYWNELIYPPHYKHSLLFSTLINLITNLIEAASIHILRKIIFSHLRDKYQKKSANEKLLREKQLQEAIFVVYASSQLYLQPWSWQVDNYSVLDPLTMTPMITHGGSISVNPLGVPMKPEQKVWQKMFIKNIPQECSNENMTRLLNEFCNIKNFKRTADNRGRLLPFCHFEIETGEEILRFRRLFNNVKILDNTLEMKISPETENFIKEWINMQKDEWRKKLQAPGMNEAKEYDSIQDYHVRDDKKYKQKVEETIKLVNIQVKKIAADRMREEQRKEHPREKERIRNKKKATEQLERMFATKEDQVLKREREKQRQSRKQKERERQREKQRMKRLQRQLNLDDEQLEKRIVKFLNAERRKQIQREEQEDLQVMMQQNPPLPEQMPQEVPQEPQPRKVKAVVQEEIILGNEKIADQVLVEAPKVVPESEQKPKDLQKNQLFDNYQEMYEEKKQKEIVELQLPQIHNQEDNEEQQRRQQAIKQLQKKVPQNKMELWDFQINWDKLAKSTVLQRNIRPWLEEMSNYYIGGVEQKFIALVEKKLLSRSHPDKIIKILKQLLDDESEEFVIRLWKKLVLEYLKLQNDLL